MNPRSYSHLTKVPKTYIKEKADPSTNGAKKTGCPCLED
jgi:hypothetical protein